MTHRTQENGETCGVIYDRVDKGTVEDDAVKLEGLDGAFSVHLHHRHRGGFGTVSADIDKGLLLYGGAVDIALRTLAKP